MEPMKIDNLNNIKYYLNMEKEINKYKSLLADIQTKYNITIYECCFCERYEIGEDLEFISFCNNCQKECCNNHRKILEGKEYCIECYS